MTHQEIDKLAYEATQARIALTDLFNEREEVFNAARKTFAPAIDRASRKFTDCVQRLRSAVAAAPELYEEPKSRTAWDFKVGWRKGKGGLEWDADDAVVARARKLLSEEEFNLVIKTTYRPIASALQECDAGTLKKLGVTIHSSGDEPFCRLAQKEVSQVVSSILKESASQSVS